MLVKDAVSSGLPRRWSWNWAKFVKLCGLHGSRSSRMFS
jgi:hypothetical protein